MIGTILDNRYKIEELVGEGGMGIVYRASEIETEEIFAIKVMSEKMTSPDIGKRFLREVMLQSRLQHPGIVSATDFSKTPSGQYYFVMPYIKGLSLRSHIKKEGPLSLPSFLVLARQLLQAVSYAHNQGIIHRDLNSENVFLVPSNGDFLLKILDFGLAKGTGNEDTDAKLTLEGRVLGSPAFMSPEQAGGEISKLGPQSDIYTLGILFYYMLVGSLPFHSKAPMEIFLKHIQEPPPSLREKNPEIPLRVEVIVHKCLKKKPELRFLSAQELENALVQAYYDHQSNPTPTTVRGDSKKTQSTQSTQIFLILMALASVACITGLILLVMK